MKLLIFVSLLCLKFACWPVLVEEPGEAFLEALRERGYFDVALDYLKEMESSELASDEFRATLPFEKAQTLISSTGRIRNREQLEERLAQAESLLKQAETDAQTAELKARSQDCLGDLLFQRARNYLTMADNRRLTSTEKEEYLQQARGYLRNALLAFGKAKATYRQVLDDYQIDLRNPESKRRLKRLRGIYTVVRVKMPQILEQLADTLDVDDPERGQSLALATAEFQQLWQKYPNFPAGLDSCLYAARCLYKQNQYPEALSFLQEILNLPESNALLTLKRRAMVLAADCWAESSPYPYDDVIANLERYIKRLTRREQRESDWQRIQLELAKAYREKAATLKEQDGDPGRIRSLERDASRLIKTVARLPGDHRQQARQLASEWKLGTDFESEVEEKPVHTFAEARQQGLDLMTELEALHADVIQLRRQKASSGKDAVDDPSTQADLDTATQQLQTLANRCLETFGRALLLADGQTSREDINQIRYLQAACYYAIEQYFEAALVGEFLVERYPTVAFSRPAGLIGIRSCAILYDQAEPQDKQFERSRLRQLAEKILKIWPGTDEASTAAATLARLILTDKDLAEEQLELAADLIRQVAESSPDRAALNLRLGTKLWFACRQEQQQETENRQQREEQLTAAIEYLSDGLNNSRADEMTMEAVWGSLFLVEALLQQGKLGEAVQQLEAYPLALIKQKNRTLVQSSTADLFIRESFRVAAKTYLTALENEPGEKKWIDKVTGIVQAMQSRTDPAAQQDVVNMYRLIAAQLDQQLDALDDPGQRKLLAENLSGFLGNVQMESQDPNTIIWAGKTLLELARFYQDGASDADAKPLLNMALAALERASALGIDDEKLAMELKRQQAIAKRGLGQYEQAFAGLVQLLKQSPNAWPIQNDAAETLQRWGVQAKAGERLAQALTGTEKYRDPKTKRQRNLVWGWTRLSSVLKRYPKLEDAYFRSVFGEVETRLEFGLVEQNQKAMAAALKKLNQIKAQDEDLGGPVWKPRFENLELRIRQNLTSGQVSGKSN